MSCCFFFSLSLSLSLSGIEKASSFDRRNVRKLMLAGIPYSGSRFQYKALQGISSFCVSLQFTSCLLTRPVFIQTLVQYEFKLARVHLLC